MSNRSCKGMHDVRSMRTVTGRSHPQGKESTYVDFHRLQTEKARLQRELVIWQTNAERVQTRLADIEAQVRQLDSITDHSRAARSETVEDSPAFEEMTLTY